MENIENTVDFEQQSAPDDAALAGADSLSSIVEDTPQNTQQEPPKEPGWIKQRVNKAVEKAVAEAEARMRDRYEAILAPIRESALEREATDLVAQGEFKSLERAKEYLRLKQGMPAESSAKAEPQQQVQQPNRDDQGRFAKSEQGDAVTRARADLLAEQAQKIKKNRGVDVMNMFNANEEVKQRVLSGEWDFYDVADQMSAARSTPAPMRSPNSNTVSGVTIASMTDEQFARLQRNLASGKTYDLRK